MKRFHNRIRQDLKYRILEINRFSKWVDMRTLYESLKRYKAIVCLINETILAENGEEFQYKDWIREIIVKCLREYDHTGTPPLLIIKSNKLNRSQYPDVIDHFECLECDDGLSEDQFEQLLDSLTEVLSS